MRIPYASICGVLGILAGAVATFAVAATVHPKPAAPVCGCQLKAVRPARHAVHVRRRAHAPAGRRLAHWSGHGGHMMGDGMMDGRMMGHHMWRDEQISSEAHGWSEDEGRWGYGHGGRFDLAWAERPWATDVYGYLTWPGKTHFVNGHAVQGDPPPPPPEGAGPPEGWQPPPPGAAGEDERSYDIYRF